MKKLYVVGLGAGDEKYRTMEANRALEQSQVLVGYPVYLDLIPEFHQGREILSSGMTQEVERCHMALEQAQQGKTLALVCSGDSTVYGMAGLIYQLAHNYPEVEIEIVSGVTAALTGGSLLGAPLSGDFVVLSLSDLLTPLDVMHKRIEAAAMGDFVTVIYNPSSKKRGDYLQKACEIFLKYQKPETICGTVQHIGRKGENSQLYTLEKLQNVSVDMFTTVFIGNSQTVEISGKMVTSRGYEKKYDLEIKEELPWFDKIK